MTKICTLLSMGKFESIACAADRCAWFTSSVCALVANRQKNENTAVSVTSTDSGGVE